VFKRNPPLQALPFKDSIAAFEHYCKYGSVDIKEKIAIPALILDQRKEPEALQLMTQAMNKGENVFNAFLTKVASEDGGFKCVALCYDKKVAFSPNDLVYWVPMYHLPKFSLVTDKRAGWIGNIVAKLTPTLRLDTGFEIVERY
jgi:hypothetical protein